MLHRLITENPALLFTAIFLAAFTLLGRFQIESRPFIRKLGLAFGLVAALGFVSVLALNAVRGGLLWHDEANILSIAAAWRNGQPMYHAATAPEFYALFYGPVTYLVYAPLLHATTHSLLFLRLLVSLVDLISLLLLLAVIRVWLPVLESIALLSVAVVTLLAYPDQLLGIRGDPWLLFFASLALFLVMRASRRWPIASMMLAGVAMGFAIDLKATVVPLMYVLVVLAFYRLGRASAMIAATAGAIVAVGIFFIHGISMPNYIHWLETASRQPFLRSTLLLNLLVLFLLLLPSLHLRWRRIVRAGRRDGEANVLLFSLIAIVVCVGTGSKFSAGPWHLWPLIPLLLAAGAYELSTASNRERRTEEARPHNEETRSMILHRKTVQIASLAVAGGLTALFFTAKDLQILRPLAASSFQSAERVNMAELESDVSQDHIRPLVMGYGSNLNDERTNLRYALQLAGEPYVFDENEVVEARKESLSVSSELIASVRSCADDWLLPHGDAPFSAIRGGLVLGDAKSLMFPRELRSNFLAKYSLVQQGTAYDIWRCQTMPDASQKASLY